MPARSTIRAVAGVLAAATVVAAVQPGGASAAGGGQKTKKADLSVTALSGVPSTVARTVPLPLTATVRNRGKVTATKGTVTLWWSADTRAGGDTLLARVGAPGLGPGRTAEVEASASIPAAVTGGGYVLACSTSPKDASSRNDCKASTPTTVPAVVTTPTSPTTPQQPTPQESLGDPISGELRGDLHFVDEESKAQGTWSDTWDYRADVSVNLAISGPDVLDSKVTSSASEYDLYGKRRTHQADPTCSRTDEETHTGSGRFPWTGDPYQDRITADIATIDLSEVSMVIYMRYDQDNKSTTCEGTTSRTGKATTIIELEFVQVSRTAKSIRYAVKGYHDVDSTTSEFETLTGQLELSLD